MRKGRKQRGRKIRREGARKRSYKVRKKVRKLGRKEREKDFILSEDFVTLTVLQFIFFFYCFGFIFLFFAIYFYRD